jgi:hypothetical protein
MHIEGYRPYSQDSLLQHRQRTREEILHGALFDLEDGKIKGHMLTTG